MNINYIEFAFLLSKNEIIWDFLVEHMCNSNMHG